MSPCAGRGDGFSYTSVNCKDAAFGGMAGENSVIGCLNLFHAGPRWRFPLAVARREPSFTPYRGCCCIGSGCLYVKSSNCIFFCACPLIVRDGQPEFREGNGRVTVGSGDVAW
jgi:hypothetical protein